MLRPASRGAFFLSVACMLKNTAKHDTINDTNLFNEV